MKPERWEQIGEVYHAALEIDPERRAGFLNEVCAGDLELRREVESLIAAEEKAGAFIAEPALNDAAKIFSEDQISSAPSSSDPLLEGRNLGRYQIVSLLGEGGMGEVYLARDPRLDRKVALKLLRPDFGRDETRARRFAQEARAASALNHPNIITIHEIGQAEGRRYIATEFIEGRALRRIITQGALSLSDALDIAAQTASALQAAHDAGIVHRDIKPENIMVRPDGLVKVVDFGLAKLIERQATMFDTNAPSSLGFRTEPGTIMGTVAYMSPEQARGGSVDARSDIFSLGVVCYEMIAGRAPFRGETLNHVVVAILDKDPAPLSAHAPETPDELQRIVNNALHKDREKRYRTAAEFLTDLKALLERTDLQVTFDGARADSATASAGQLLGYLNRRRQGVIIALIAIVIAIASSLFYFGRQPSLTEKDLALLADFVNLTGDEVFDNTLKQALAVHLEQTPFLSFIPEERVRETLGYMGRQPDERLTKELAREICLRQGVRALVIGSIARFDRRYSITLEAINSQTGERIAAALAEAEGKDQTLRALGIAANQLRERLGESLTSIQKFAAPLEQATTSRLDALKAWSRGLELARSGKSGVIPMYKHATELDPNFAKAYVSLSLAYSYSEQPELAAECAAKAFALKDRVTEREKFDIAANYYAAASGDLLKAIEALELWKQTYRRDHSPLSRLASFYRLVGQFENSLAAAREANRINPRAYAPYVSMGSALVQLNRFDEAQAIIEQALERKLATATSRRDLYQIAFVSGDEAMMKRQIDWSTGRPDEYWAFHWRAQASSAAGRLREAGDLYIRAAELAAPSQPERAAWFTEEVLLRSAACDLCRQIKSGAVNPPAASLIRVQSYIPTDVSRALALALCGETEQAQTLADEAAGRNRESTLTNAVWLPVIRAAIELKRGDPDRALRLLQANIQYERATLFWSPYLRGQAHLLRKSGTEAIVEFRKILDNRGWDAISPLWPMAQLGLARATALTADGAGAHSAYQDFLETWKGADPDLPVLVEARREFAALKSGRVF